MSIKRLLRPVVDRFARLSGQLANCEKAMSSGVTILMYHRVLPRKLPRKQADANPLASLAIPAEAFEQQMKWLVGHCNVMTVAEAMGGTREDSGDRPIVCVTFDDGYLDNYEVAGPILAKHDLKATFFLTAGMLESGQPLWFDHGAILYKILDPRKREAGTREVLADEYIPSPDLPSWMTMLKELAPNLRLRLLDALDDGGASKQALAQCPLMSFTQARELAEQGHEIGSHTLTHPLLPQLDDDELAGELAGSRSLLAEKLGREIAGFCYPNGDHDQRVIEAARKAGYAYACTTTPGRNQGDQDHHRLLRIDINPRRVLSSTGIHDELSFRAEISLLRARYR